MYKIYICAVELLSSRNSLWSFSFSPSRTTVRDRRIIFMELHDNHIRIYRSILQVLQSLSRDNRSIFISLVLFETWLYNVSDLQFFSPWQPALPFFLVPRDSVNPVFLVLSPWPRTLVRRQQKSRSTLFIPEEQSPPHLWRRARVTQPKNCSLSVLLLFDLLPCCPVYKLT